MTSCVLKSIHPNLIPKMHLIHVINQFEPNRIKPVRQSSSPLYCIPSFDFLSFLGWFPGRPDPFCISIHSYVAPCHIEPTQSTLSPHCTQPAERNQLLYHSTTTVSGMQLPLGTMCTSCTSRLEQSVLYQFTSWHPALHVLVLCTMCTFLCLHSRSFHDIPLFLNPLSRLLTRAVITRHLPPSHHGHSFMSSTYPSSIQHPYIHSAQTPWTWFPLILALSLSLLPRPPHPFKLSVSYPPSNLMPHHTHIVHLHTVHSSKT
jgi:hypothetical protein